MAVITILPQFPKFNAFCTLEVDEPSLSLILTNKVPIIEKIIPVPAISIGKRIGAKPPNASSEIVSLPKTMVASTVAT